MAASTTGRPNIVRALREELLGPAPAGKPLSLNGAVKFSEKTASYGPWFDEATGEEILERDPLVRYGVGVLHPSMYGSTSRTEDLTIVAGLTAEDTDGPDNAEWEGPTKPPSGGDSDDADFELSGANELKPSAIGISFLIDRTDLTSLDIRLEAGRYREVRVDIPEGRQRTWWVRTPITAVWRLSPQRLAMAACAHRELVPVAEESTGLDGLAPRLTVNLRPHPQGLLVTVALVNHSEVGTQPVASKCLFQTTITATPQQGCLIAYPESAESNLHPDDASFRLIYRHAQTYAIGHGCAANWDGPDAEGRSAWAQADPLPEYEVPSITPDILLASGKALTVSMAQLAGTEPGGMAQLQQVLAAYDGWIQDRKTEAAGLSNEYRPTADLHIGQCEQALKRMREGVAMVSDADSLVGQAFRLANEAMLKQQLRSGTDRRPTIMKDGRLEVDGTPPGDTGATGTGRGHWRAFQIAFLLAALPSTADTAHLDREAVDLIFFPTGGGKTEAYLGLSAFAMLLRRLRQPSDVSVTVLMRYTLRLLTAQQFLRAAGLICALESIRLDRNDLGGDPFSIGIWVGGDSTPNSHADATALLRKLQRGEGDNPFLLLRCPWCAAQMGPVQSTETSGQPGSPLQRGGRRGGRKPRNAVAGYEEYAGHVIFRCPDRTCLFATEGNPLPVYVVDDDVYEHRPSLVIGTVDKFALLAWRPDARALFGIGDSGKRAYSPPELVIQDELHLIAGPLGSMTGLYEGVIEELCTDRRGTYPAPPKIIASTATIRRHEEQVKSLYGRSRVHLFPPHGINAEDSFFAVYAHDRDTGELLPGRRYIGVHAPALGSMQTTQVRSFAALLQAAKDAPEGERDPWWTLMAFFNSLRELGNSLSLMQSDIPDYLKTINNRSSADRSAVRYLNFVEEMTSRLRQDQIPESMEKLARNAESGKAIDACLASSLIEVGIDIDRLSLMTVVGQPKSTSQYIQVTGRVGRKADQRPGLIVTLYGASKPRDRSHFERFRSYHQRLYAQVEPTSATPFSPPAIDRALHAAVIAFIRQTAPKTLDPYPFPEDLFNRAADLLLARSEICDPEEKGRLATVLAGRRKEWENWKPREWGAPGGEAHLNQLMHPAGQYVNEDVEQMTWATPTSMRGADAECRAKVTHLYARDGAQR
ncbi:helicase-related protein [Streptomyces sp. NPDC001820]|uniref:helicase-related protein n=1 Tax=Streptomyces sp. NPDC001820 TaxID=3364613 RepID=UPI0036860A65